MTAKTAIVEGSGTGAVIVVAVMAPWAVVGPLVEGAIRNGLSSDASVLE